MAEGTPNPDADFLERAKTVQVESSNVAWLQYKGGTLFVGYLNGGRYYCENVDPETALRVRNADSVGRALRALQETHGVFKKCQ